MEVFQQAIAFDRAIRIRAAERVTHVPGGVVVRHDRLAPKYHLNALLLDAPLNLSDGADALCAVADEHLAHVEHRQVVFDDAAAADRLAPALLDRGWKCQRVVFMQWRGTEVPSAREGVAKRIGERTIRDIQLAMTIEETGTDNDPDHAFAETLVAGEQALRTGTRWVAFGAGEDDRLTASSTLYLERREGQGGIAMIDEVGTLAAYRRRGLARAVVVAALETALRSACDPIVIPADAEDWPRELYARLGFEPVGTQVSFTLEQR